MKRPLRRPSDFARFVGEDVELTTTAMEGRRSYKGAIAAATDACVTIQPEGEDAVTIAFDDVKKCTLKPVFDFKGVKERELTMADADFTMMEALMELCQEKHIDQLYLLDRLEAALAETYARVLKLDWGLEGHHRPHHWQDEPGIRLEPIDDSMDEEGNFTEYEEIDVTPKDVSRLAAQTAKAEINAIVRNAAREQIYEEFSGRVGDSSTAPCYSPRPTSPS